MAKKIGASLREEAQGASAVYGRVEFPGFDATLDGKGAAWPKDSVADSAGISGHDSERPVTASEVAAIVREVLSEMKIYVLESDITDAQNAVRGVVEQTYF